MRLAGVRPGMALADAQRVKDLECEVKDPRCVDQWHLRHISLRDDDQGDFIPVGEMRA
jgi:hypothetical protein